MAQQKYNTIHYHSYLALDEILGAQRPRSAELEEEMAHDEMLFIIIHQVYELWFKQILHDLTSVRDMFNAQMVDERNIGVAVARLDRVVEIQKLLISQIRVLETMTPLDFLDFRKYLFPASGFQSFQFRKVEVLLGLREEERITYNSQPYTSAFQPGQVEELRKMEEGGSLFDLIEDWLERTPFLQFRDFNFRKHYQRAVEGMLEKERQAILASDYLNEEETEQRLRMLGGADSYFRYIFEPEHHERLREEGSLRLSYRATIAALLINLYRDEPILHMPYMLMTRLIDIDEYFTSWRYRHAQMVMRMLGRKIGTGGSSGYEYLRSTAQKHHIFTDFHNISTLLIPRSVLPELPPDVRRELGFYYSQKEKNT